MRYLVWIALVASSAVADPAARQAAEQLARQARTTGNLATFEACGRAYLAIYNADPSEPTNDEVLYNAGACFAEGKSLGAAEMAFGTVVEVYPSSRIAARALGRMAKIFGDTALYDRAADALESYATRYAGEKDAIDALADAIRFRTALGDTAKASANTQRYIRTYGAKRPDDAALAQLHLALALEGDAAIAAIRAYLKMRDRDQGRTVFMHAKLGELLWTQSCKHSDDGLCIERRSVATRCRKIEKVSALPRTAARKEALAELDLAVKGFARIEQPRDEVRHGVARAKLALIDAETERALAHRELADSRRYAAIAELKDPETTVAAAARIGELALFSIDAGDTGDTGGACESVERAESHATELFATCLHKSIELAIAPPAVCAREAHRLAPDLFPVLAERRAQLGYAPIVAVEPGLATLDTPAP